MRAVLCRAFGPPDDLEIVDIPTPERGIGEVLVDVRTAAVNFPDVLFIKGEYQVARPPPFVPGCELSGVVRAADPDSGLVPGDRVFGTLGTGGAFAEQAVVPARQLERIPAGTGFDDAAVIAVAYRCAVHAVHSVARATAGEWVVVLGAAGGVGSAAVDIALGLGANVIAAVSGPGKAALCRERGATATIDYGTEDLRARIREITGRGAHVVVDPVGGALAEPALRSLVRGGRFVTLGFASGEIPAVPLNLVLLKGITVTGIQVAEYPVQDPERYRAGEAELARLLTEGLLRPHIGARFDLDDTAAAVRCVAERRALGKVLVSVSRGAEDPGTPPAPSVVDTAV